MGMACGIEFQRTFKGRLSFTLFPFYYDDNETGATTELYISRCSRRALKSGGPKTYPVAVNGILRASSKRQSSTERAASTQ